jgi:hypothetical protein
MYIKCETIYLYNINHWYAQPEALLLITSKALVHTTISSYTYNLHLWWTQAPAQTYKIISSGKYNHLSGKPNHHSGILITTHGIHTTNSSGKYNHQSSKPSHHPSILITTLVDTHKCQLWSWLSVVQNGLVGRITLTASSVQRLWPAQQRWRILQ